MKVAQAGAFFTAFMQQINNHLSEKSFFIWSLSTDLTVFSETAQTFGYEGVSKSTCTNAITF